MSIWIIVPMASLVCYSALLALTIFRGYRAKVNLWFGIYLASMIVWSFGSFMAHLDHPGVDTLFWNRVLSAGSMTMPFAVFCFVQAFLGLERKNLLFFALILFIIDHTLNSLGLVIESAYVSKGRLINQYGPAVSIASFTWLLFIGISAYFLVKEFRTTKDTVFRNRLKYLLSVIFVIFAGSMTNTTGLSVYPVDIGFNVVSAGLIGYAILRYQLLDLSVVIRKSLLYSIPTILIGALYFLVLNFVWRQINSLSNQQVFWVSLLVAVLSAIVAQPVRDKAQWWVDRLFFREKHDVGLMLRRVTHTAATVLDINALTNMILKEINTNLHVSTSAFFLKCIDQDDFELSTQEGLPVNTAIRLRKDHPIVMWFISHDQPLSRMDIEIIPQFLAMWGQERNELNDLGAELFIPVKTKQVLVGIMAIGPKRSEETFSMEDHATLMTLASQTAVAVENARLFAEARQRTNEMTRLNAAIHAELGERLRAQEALKESEERFRRLAENAPDLIYRFRVAPDYGYEFVSPALNDMIGYTPEDIIDNPDSFSRIIHPEDLPIINDILEEKIGPGPVLMRLIRKDKSIVWTEQHIVLIHDQAGRLAAVEGIARDITLRKQDEEELAARIKQLEKYNREMKILNDMGDVLQACQSREEAYPVIEKYLPQLFTTEAGTVYVMGSGNDVVETVASWGASSTVDRAFEPENCWALRRSKPHLVECADTALHCKHINYKETAAHLCLPMMAQGEALGLLTLLVNAKECDSELHFDQSKQQLAMTVAEHIALALANIQLNETLRQQAIRDPLTNLYNRRYMEESLGRELARAARSHSSLAIIFIDIDHFKLFNDHFGHDAGDAVLRELGHFLKTHIRAEDIACRYGGEEFILILPDTPLETACCRAEEIRQGVSHLSVLLRDQQYLKEITLSQGISIFPENGHTTDALLRSADLALYQAKQEGRNRFMVAEMVL